MTDLGLQPAGLVVEVARHLDPLELAALELTPIVSSRLKKIRDSHHALARAMASGMTNIDAGRITGFDNVYISIMKADPAFQELLEFYKEHDGAQQADLRERMTLIALDVSQEIRDRLHEAPETFTATELRQLLTNLADRVGFGPSQTVHSTVDLTENLSYADQRLLADALKALEKQSAATGSDRVAGAALSGEARGAEREIEHRSREAEDLQPLPERGDPPT